MKQIQLSRGMVALVDDSDFEWLNQWNWYPLKLGKNQIQHYAQGRMDGRQLVTMHRVIMGFPPFDVDHRNTNGLDNQRHNLREATRSQNLHNKAGWSRCGFKGVSFLKPNKLWQARIDVKGKQIHMGYFDTPEEAARAYDEKALELVGPFARLNFSSEQPTKVT